LSNYIRAVDSDFAQEISAGEGLAVVVDGDLQALRSQLLRVRDGELELLVPNRVEVFRHSACTAELVIVVYFCE